MSSKHSMHLCDAEEMTGQGSGEQPGLGDLSANAHGILSASSDRQDGQAARPGEEEIAEFSRETPAIGCHQEVRPQVPNHSLPFHWKSAVRLEDSCHWKGEVMEERLLSKS